MEPRFIDRLQENLGGIAQAMIDALRRKYPLYTEGSPRQREAVRELALRICEDFLTHLRSGGEIPAAALPDLLPLPADSRGFELRDLVDMLGLAKEAGWRFIRERLVEEGDERSLLELAEALDGYYRKTVTSLASSYLNRQQEGIANFNRLLNQFRMILDRGELMERITATACRGMGYSRSVFYLYERDALLPASAYSLRDELWGRNYLEPLRYYPISPFGNSLECKAFFRPSLVAARRGEFPPSAFSLIKPMPEAPFALVPINPSGSPKGLLYVESDPDRLTITHWELELLQIYADTVGLALENARLYREVSLKGRALDHLMSRVNTAHEEERARIARELHDSVAQSLLKIIYSAGFALDFLKEDPRLAEEEIEDIQERAKECIAELRAIIGNLRPSSLEILGLPETVRRMAEQFEQEYGINTRVDLRGMDELTSSAEMAVFRILQEALTNVRKHSGAGAVWISSRLQDGQLVLVIEDNGRGFDMSSVEHEQERGRHLGLLAMRERTELMGGEFKVRSAPGRGTTITIRLPLLAGEKRA
jgi:signal transduction histidine kinase